MQEQHLSAFVVISYAPSVNPFFRLEEKHRRSGEDQVIVPAGERQREVYEQIAIRNSPVFDFYLNCLIALCANGFDDRVCVDGGGDAEHVPGAVGVIGLSIGMDFEIRGNP